MGALWTRRATSIVYKPASTDLLMRLDGVPWG